MRLDKRVLVVANGDNDVHYLHGLKDTYDLIIAADGASNILSQAGIKPDIIVGDFDSIEAQVLARYGAEDIRLVKLNSEKDYSDTHVAIDTAIDEGAGTIDLVGAVGGRWDHSIANLNLLYYGFEKGINLSMVSQDNSATIKGKGQYTMAYKPNNFFSFFAIFEDAVVSLENMKYPLNNKYVKRGESIGLSNEYEPGAKVTVVKGSILIVESKKDRA